MPGQHDIDPEILQCLGTVVITWAEIEELLGEFLAYLLKADRGSVYAITQNVSDATITGWIRALISVGNIGDDDAGQIGELLTETDRLRAERNALVHGLWRVASQPGAAIVHTIRLDRSEIMVGRLTTKADLDVMIEDMRELALNLMRIGRHFGYLSR